MWTKHMDAPDAVEEANIRADRNHLERPSVAKYGDTVLLHLTGKLKDGVEFDSTRRCGPVQFTIGSGQVRVYFFSAHEVLEIRS